MAKSATRQHHSQNHVDNSEEAYRHQLRRAQRRQAEQDRLIFRGLVFTLVALMVYATFQRSHVATVPHSFTPPNRQPLTANYAPAPLETYILDHTKPLGLSEKPPAVVETCHIWTDRLATPYYDELHQFAEELKTYYKLLNDFRVPSSIKDIRFDKAPNGGDVCDLLELHPKGLPGIFQSQQLSRTSSGYVEPLLPPMRHPALCLEEGVKDPTRSDKFPQLMQIRYLVHDWGAMCRKLKPNSKTVFVDMGASLEFHVIQTSPALVLLEQFRRFGFKFDHIYAYEMRPHDPNNVQNLIPKQFKSAYHWINVGVQPETSSDNNPWKLLLENYNADDLIVVKLDIDTPAIEHELAYQLLNNPRLTKLVDHFYFEHHVNQKELMYHWGPTRASVEESFQLFHGLRQKGVASHFWV